MSGVWLPFTPSWPMPEGLRGEVVDYAQPPWERCGDVEMVVLPYGPDDNTLAGLAEMPVLRVVQSLAAGVDRVLPFIPPAATLCSARGVHDTATAELAVTLTLSALRGVAGFTRDQAQRRWQPRTTPGLADKTVLVVGYGSIGAAIAARLECFEAHVVPVARTPRPGVSGMSDLSALLPDADVVVLSLPLTPETRGLVNADFLARMRAGALLVNVARGAVVDTRALLAALHRGHVSAALDVTDPEPLPEDSPLWDAPNLILTPHVGARSEALAPRMMRFVGEQVSRFAEGRSLRNVVGWRRQQAD
ncbi:dihydrofolate reductase [Mycobacterium sp. MS1601]|uniref:2-hydroxyacid dehydrogenase n=1 Tax=Mycobacterium sp. MS1601 TaxID=1936029 RepID=UPI0009790A99|nr:2-hydroxyacid dehydrogenase [Mycobacterium sp. MS1601]AQA01356.1 dihydrofolate reductase [Mycobacterium sp. MS1601]